MGPGALGAALAVVAIVCLPLPPLRSRVLPERPVAAPGLPWLSTSNGRIVDSLGRTVILRGFNDDALLQTGGQPPPPPLTPADATLMQAEGFDVVRLPISWSLLEPRPGHFSRHYLDRLRAVVALCASHHLYVVLDMHTEDFGVGSGGSGAPRWLYLPGVPNWSLPFLDAAWRRHTSTAVNADLAYFWLYPNWQRLYWQAWAKVAQLFRGDSAVAGYDLYNEPHPLPLPPAIFETRLLWPFYAQGVSEIARIDPNHLFILEGDLFGDLPTAIRPLRAKDIVYSTHLYVGSILPPSYTGDRQPLQRELRQGLQEAQQLPAAYWVSELGIDKTRPIAFAWAEAEIALSNRFQTGWAWWEWNDPDGWGVEQGSGAPDRAWLAQLAQPFVRASPGRLAYLAFDRSSRVLRATIRGGRGGLALVAWPQSRGSPQSLSSCARPAHPYLAGSGVLALRITTKSCQVEIKG